MEVPDFFRCPISMELMKDPVTIPTGVTYDRRSIEKWFFVYKKSTCPATGQTVVSTTDITPNHTLRRLITAWIEDPGRTSSSAAASSPPSTSASAAVNKDDLASLLAAIDSSSPFKVGSLKKLREAVESGGGNARADFVSLGGIETLGRIVIQVLLDSTDSFHHARMRARTRSLNAPPPAPGGRIDRARPHQVHVDRPPKRLRRIPAPCIDDLPKRRQVVQPQVDIHHHRQRHRHHQIPVGSPVGRGLHRQIELLRPGRADRGVGSSPFEEEPIEGRRSRGDSRVGRASHRLPEPAQVREGVVRAQAPLRVRRGEVGVRGPRGGGGGGGEVGVARVGRGDEAFGEGVVARVRRRRTRGGGEGVGGDGDVWGGEEVVGGVAC
ncbi:E3 ubiquitin-protein ligase PUB22 [Acorus calamus]|uniref:U-box domain-containing protein n=1 Tax=Acorus calamus TaxID=4465 RepID=A0AAV9FKH3_ACOCL|nr:E3 ubiquitin-protein ligase PUB22 [Acorus calamus]